MRLLIYLDDNFGEASTLALEMELDGSLNFEPITFDDAAAF